MATDRMRSRETQQIVLFAVLALAASAALAALARFLGNEGLAFLVIFTPTLLAAVLTAFFSGPAGLRRLFVDRVLARIGWFDLLLALALVPALAVLVLVAGGGPLAATGVAVMPQILFIVLISLGEEFGWRGFLLDRLLPRAGLLPASLVVGLVWGLWHAPGAVIGVGVPPEIPFALFVLWVLPLSHVMALIYREGRSVLATILLHTSANATFNYLPVLPEQGGTTTGFALLVALAWGCAILLHLWRAPRGGNA